jgi:hypothetical protein
MWSCQEALAFGRRAARLTVLRLGWNPRATTSSLLPAQARAAGVTPASRRPQTGDAVRPAMQGPLAPVPVPAR